MSPQKEDPTPAREVKDQSAVAKSGVQYRRIAEFAEEYANNTLFETSNWDMKIIFGQLDQSLGPNVVLQHTAITMPWPQVKVLVYFLSLNLLFHEARAGRVQILAGLVPDMSQRMPKELREEGITSEETWRAAQKLYEDFIAANPEADPKKKMKA
jgi:hypothetical protein